MSNNTIIQWTDSTVNPVMGCDGCELWPTVADLRKKLATALLGEFSELSKEQAHNIAHASVGEIALTSHLYQRRKEVVESAVKKITSESGHDISNSAKRRLAVALVPTCYAGILHTRRGEDPRNADKGVNPGFARVFEEPKLFAGRMALAANYPDLRGKCRPESPWKDGLPRLIFISDMGDALSKNVPFDFLQREIIDVVSSEKGSRHVWQWLTKRPKRLAEFARWLEQKGMSWPRNLVAMTSVTSMKTAGRVKELLKVPASIRALSVEPLYEAVQLDLEGIDWVIVGGASGTGAMAFDLAWARDLQGQCRAAGVAFFVKQLGASPVESGSRLKLRNPHGGNWAEWPEDLRVREMPSAFYELGVADSEDPDVTVPDGPIIPELEDFDFSVPATTTAELAHQYRLAQARCLIRQVCRVKPD